MKRDPRTALLQATADRQDHVLIGRTALLTAHTQSRAQAAEILSDLRTHGIYGGSITYVTVGDVRETS
ncbi:hypothetical protein COCSUDRAFT_54583 [Coccomyxa subellipsoidea C-169]|uniref:Uncharacterized protein n=1 Tax=Coccomyxa subellipsoidea (strain C-169) TaxID=574566 RepID=I0YMR8_COCSC|nr:hypothetical protein COCSUDRAFT_54583 [Coccomyxa subellipsoidea C-169]EIE19687.1 hypothetical protein COCSUDRAFT_54583 [Coccomyxa subellipsoidea C-169]|eukprot:XP_005644231.1 hypothetical protein COCSUDRAFT_54583 [Coccomyxa subellipsoidea C-169]